MKYFILILLYSFLIGCSSSTSTNSGIEKNQLIITRDDESYIDKDFVINLIKHKEEGDIELQVKDVSSLVDQLAANNVLSDDEVVRLEFNTPIEQVYFQHFAHDFSHNDLMEHVFIIGNKDGGTQLLFIVSERRESDRQFYIAHTELLGSQYAPSIISIIKQKEEKPILYVRVESSPGTGISRRHDTFYQFNKSSFLKILQLDCGRNMNGTLQTETRINNIDYNGDEIHVNYLLKAWICPSFSTSIPVESSTAWNNNNVHDCAEEAFLVLLSDSIQINFAPFSEENGTYSTTYNKEKLELLAIPQASEEYAKKLFYFFEDGILHNNHDKRVTEAIKWMKKRFILP